MSKTPNLTNFLDRFWYLKQAWAIFKTKYLALAVLELLSWAVLVIIIISVVAISTWFLNQVGIINSSFDALGLSPDSLTLDSVKHWLISVRNTHSASFWQFSYSLPFLLIFGLLTLFSSMYSIAFLTIVESKTNDYWAEFKTSLRHSFWPLTLASLVSGLIIQAGLTLFIIPGLWLVVSFIFLPYFIVLAKLTLWPSIVASIRQLKRSFWTVVQLIIVFSVFSSLVDDIVKSNPSVLSMLLNALASWISSALLMLSFLSIYRQSVESKADQDLITIKSDPWIKWAKALAILGVIALLGVTVLLNLGTEIIFNTDYIGSK